MTESYGDFRITVFDVNRYPLAELETDFHCVWALDEQGVADFTLSARYDEKCTPDIIKPGNYVLFEHAHHGDWAGVIMPHDYISWSGNGEVTVRLREAMVQWGRRRSPLFNFEDANISISGPASGVLRTAIRWANSKVDAGLREGDIRPGEKPTLLRLVYTMWSDIIEKFAKRNKVRVWTTPGRDDHGLLIFYVNAVPLSELRTDAYYPLMEDINIETPRGEFYRMGVEMKNDIVVINEAESDGGFLQVHAQDQASIYEYGLWQWSEAQSTDEPLVLDQYTNKLLSDSKELQQRPMVTAIESDESPDTFTNLREGVFVRVMLHSVGLWHGQQGVDVIGQVASREIDTASKRCILTLEYE